MASGLLSQAVVFEQPGKLDVRSVSLTPAGPEDLVVDIESTGSLIHWYLAMKPSV